MGGFFGLARTKPSPAESLLLLEGDESGNLLLEGDESGSLLLEGDEA